MKLPPGTSRPVLSPVRSAVDADPYRLPRQTWRLWMPCDLANVTAQNPCGFHPPILDGGWERRMAGGIWGGDLSLDQLSARFPNLMVMWARGATRTPKASGTAYTGGRIACDCWGLDAEKVAEATAPGFWPALRKRCEVAHGHGGKVAVYVGMPAEGAVESGMAKRKRLRTLDAMLAPLLDSGVDVLAMDATNVCAQGPGLRKIAAMYLAERAIARGLEVVGEALEAVHPLVYPWHDGRFGGLAARHPELEHSRWDLAATDRGWFGPGMSHAVPKLYCAMAGWVPVHLRPGMLAPASMQGTPVVNVVEMSDMPREWLGVAA